MKKEKWKDCAAPGCNMVVLQDPKLSKPAKFCSNKCKSKEFYWRCKKTRGIRPAELYAR